MDHKTFWNWPLVLNLRSLAVPLASLCLVFSLVVLSGYALEIESLYRPTSDGPGTHPLTATILFCLALSSLAAERLTRFMQVVFIAALLVALCMILLNLSDIFIGTHRAPLLTPFYTIVNSELIFGKMNATGINTSTALFFIAVSLLSHYLALPSFAQLSAFLGIAIPTISFTGYAYGLENFYAQMSLTSATLIFILGFAALARNAQANPMRSLLSPYFGGQLARVQILVSYLFPVFVGYLLLKFVSIVNGMTIGLFIVIMSWFIILLVSISAVYQNKAEVKMNILMTQLAEQAETDPLTAVANRRRFEEFLTFELKRMERQANTTLCLIMLDVDHFKRINDTAGHDIGDEVLKELASQLTNSTRSIDLVARMGGEEFVIALPDTNEQGARRVANKIQELIEHMYVPGWTDIYGPITVSIGLAAAHQSSNLQELLRLADHYVYQAKANGRNRIEPAPSSSL